MKTNPARPLPTTLPAEHRMSVPPAEMVPDEDLDTWLDLTDALTALADARTTMHAELGQFAAKEVTNGRATFPAYNDAVERVIAAEDALAAAVVAHRDRWHAKIADASTAIATAQLEHVEAVRSARRFLQFVPRAASWIEAQGRRHAHTVTLPPLADLLGGDLMTTTDHGRALSGRSVEQYLDALAADARAHLPAPAPDARNTTPAPHSHHDEAVA